MKRLIPSSLLPRVFAVTLSALLALVGLLWLVLQGGPSTTFFSQGLKSAGPSIAELVRALDAGDADATRPISIFNTSLRAARVDASFPAQAEAPREARGIDDFLTGKGGSGSRAPSAGEIDELGCEACQ